MIQKPKRYRISHTMYDIINNAHEGLFMLFTRHKTGDILTLIVDNEDIGLKCVITKVYDKYYRFCKLIKNENNENK